VNRLEREKYAPWLPSLLLGTSYGAFGAGTGGSITNGADRFDFDSAAWWEVRNLGAGERTAKENAQAQIKQARMRELETMDLVAREVVEAATQVQSRVQQMEIARQGIESAQQSHKRNRERIQNVQGLPIEMLQSIQALDQAQREYLRTVVDYNTAQFCLHRALGCPISQANF
jgi:outer membrane protein TolC